MFDISYILYAFGYNNDQSCYFLRRSGIILIFVTSQVSNVAPEQYVNKMVSKLLIDVEENGFSGVRPIIRVVNLNATAESDDVKDRLVKMFLEEAGCGTSLMSLHYSPSGDAVITPINHAAALSVLTEAFSGVGSVGAKLKEAHQELDKLVASRGIN